MNYTIFRGKDAIRETAGHGQCNGKKEYSLREARQTVNSLHKMGRFKHARIYECLLCNHWHIARSRN